MYIFNYEQLYFEPDLIVVIQIKQNTYIVWDFSANPQSKQSANSSYCTQLIDLRRDESHLLEKRECHYTKGVFGTRE